MMMNKTIEELEKELHKAKTQLSYHKNKDKPKRRNKRQQSQKARAHALAQQIVWNDEKRAMSHVIAKLTTTNDKDYNSTRNQAYRMPIEEVRNLVKGHEKEVAEDVKEAVSDVIDDVKEAVSDVVENIGEAVEDAGEAIQDAAEAISPTPQDERVGELEKQLADLKEILKNAMTQEEAPQVEAPEPKGLTHSPEKEVAKKAASGVGRKGNSIQERVNRYINNN